MLLVVLPDLGLDLMPESGAGVEHGQQDALEDQARIESLLNDSESLEQFGQALQGIILALNRNQKGASRDQSVQGEKPERRGTIEKDEMRLLHDFVLADRRHPKVIPQRLGKSPLADTLGPLQQMGFGPDQLAVRRNDRKAWKLRRLDAALDRLMLDQNVEG